MKLAVFGGTFDPIHSGHVEAAVAAANAHALDRVLVVPSGNPPHKPQTCRASYEHRFRMVELACSLDPRLWASRLEEPRTAGEPNYSIDTILRVHDTMNFIPPLRFIIGADAFAEVNLWRASEQVVTEVEFLVVGRPGFELSGSGEPSALGAHAVTCTHPASSRLVRHRAKIGGTLADLAPLVVCAYIWKHALYRH